MMFLCLIALSLHQVAFAADECLPYDSPPPVCNDYVDSSTGEPIFLQHVYNCSRFWMCEPNMEPCLYECPPMDNQGNALFFDFEIPYPDGPVCNFPEAINCTNKDPDCQCEVWQTCVNGYECIPDCKIDSHCQDNEYCDYPDGGDGNCLPGCRNGDNCGGCGTCANHQCNEPECCTDDDCPHGVCLDGSCAGCKVDNDCPGCATCGDNNECSNPECCEDSDCASTEFCDADNTCKTGCRTDADCEMPCDACVNHSCSNPECCVDTDCAADQYCEQDQTCQTGCRTDADCEMPCDACVNHSCSNPECCVDTDCAADQYCEEDQTCQTGCRSDEDCAMSCDACIDHSCSNPECCVDEDCPSGNYCEEDYTCQPGCRSDADCEMACDSCVNHSCSNPECCVDSDCSNNELCFDDNTCNPGCRDDTYCPGYDAICDLPNYTECAYCDQEDNEIGQCADGCASDANCNGLICTGSHMCADEGAVLLQSITVRTETCVDCPNSEVEDGVTLHLVGDESTTGKMECSTNKLDDLARIDYGEGVESVFSEKEYLGGCYKANLLTAVTDGSITWTAKSGEWTPSKKQVDFKWSSEQQCIYTCCLSEATLSSNVPTAKLVDCSKNCQGNKVC